MKSTNQSITRPPVPATPPGIDPSTWHAAVEFTRNQAGTASITSDERAEFLRMAWQPATWKWRTLVRDGGSVPFSLLREVWDEARRGEA